MNLFVSEVIDHCLQVGLFDFSVFDKTNALTSKSIQVRYVEMCQRSKRKEKSIEKLF